MGRKKGKFWTLRAHRAPLSSEQPRFLMSAPAGGGEAEDSTAAIEAVLLFHGTLFVVGILCVSVGSEAPAVQMESGTATAAGLVCGGNEDLPSSDHGSLPTVLTVWG